MTERAGLRGGREVTEGAFTEETGDIDRVTDLSARTLSAPIDRGPKGRHMDFKASGTHTDVPSHDLSPRLSADAGEA